MKSLSCFLGSVLVAIALPSFVSGQTGENQKFSDAVRRSQESAKIMTQIAELTTGGIPKEVTEKAQAVVIFPNVSTQKLLFEKMTKGRGVASARQSTGWTLPAYYNFAGLAEFEWGVGQESANIILLFMDKDAVNWFQKDVIEFKGEKTPLAGPVEPATEDQKNRATYTHIIAYTFIKGTLRGNTIEVAMNKGFAIGPDNHINEPLYHMKGTAVLAGKTVDPASLPQGISAFQETLQKYWHSR